MASNNYGWCQSCGALVFNSSRCHKCDGKVKPFCVDIQLVQLKERIEELKAEIQEVANQLIDLYTDCCETTDPKVYGAILGLHQRLNSNYPKR